MRTFHKLEGWSKDRDFSRRENAASVLRKNNIDFFNPAPGHFKIISEKCSTLMFYPKSGKLVWKEYKTGNQHIFQNSDEGKLIRKIKELI